MVVRSLIISPNEATLLIVPLLLIVFASCSLGVARHNNNEYIVVGVSGGLQAGFPEHDKLDYTNVGASEVQAIFLGRALVRGYKSYLDVMQPTWRQYTEEPNQPLINCNIVPTGCWHHANEYWMYAIDTRQFLAVLMNEPRFLSIAPDLGLVDLQATETSAVIRHIAQHQAAVQNKTDTAAVAFPIVTAAWYNPDSHMPSPVLYTKDDGTQVTNFPASLAKWAGVDLDNENDEPSCREDKNKSEMEEYEYQDETDKYWNKIRQAIRHAEAHRPSESQARANGPPLDCAKQARFGVSPQMARINYPFKADQLQDMLSSGGFHVDFERATVTTKPQEEENQQKLPQQMS